MMMMKIICSSSSSSNDSSSNDLAILRQLVAGFSPRKPKFSPGAAHKGLLLFKASLKQVSLLTHLSSPLCCHSPRKKSHTHTAKRKRDMTTTKYQQCTDPIKQLGPRTHTYKEPPATVHGDNRAHV
jgi:hypothetical protein